MPITIKYDAYNPGAAFKVGSPFIFEQWPTADRYMIKRDGTHRDRLSMR